MPAPLQPASDEHSRNIDNPLPRSRPPNRPPHLCPRCPGTILGTDRQQDAEPRSLAPALLSLAGNPRPNSEPPVPGGIPESSDRQRDDVRRQAEVRSAAAEDYPAVLSALGAAGPLDHPHRSSSSKRTVTGGRCRGVDVDKIFACYNMIKRSPRLGKHGASRRR